MKKQIQELIEDLKTTREKTLKQSNDNPNNTLLQAAVGGIMLHNNSVIDKLEAMIVSDIQGGEVFANTADKVIVLTKKK